MKASDTREVDLLNHQGTFIDHKDGTLKGVFDLDGKVIETTLIFNKSQDSVDVFCVPTHHYCNLGCRMCHLTAEGVDKGMVAIRPSALLESIVRMSRKGASESGARRTSNKEVLLSFMGVGDPLLNLKLIYGTFAHETQLRERGGYERVGYALSTMMPNYNMPKLQTQVVTSELPLKVHFSLHSPFSSDRRELLPKTKVDVEEALGMLRDYRDATRDLAFMREGLGGFHTALDPAEIHYTLIKGINDSDRHKEELIRLLYKYQLSFKLLQFNPLNELERSEKESNWVQDIKASLPNLRIVLYDPPGHAVGSSCGEFTKHYYLSELEDEADRQEFIIWKRDHQVE